ncbi:MAG: 3-dehydroquinate synthase, partial [Actinomycetota bacterium]|nr:3-dehydroquinate synthase [Actinomycetota bacterium]
IKAEVVARDEHDSHARAVLNYGHTFGHAIEQAIGYGGIRHGEAVSIGMMAAAYLAREMLYTTELVVSRHKEVLTDLGLPVTTDLELSDLEPAWKLDKKYSGGVRFVLLRSIGEPVIGVEATQEALDATMKRLRS